MSATSEVVHELVPNVEKIIAALHKAIALGEERGRSLTQYDLVKTLFLADRDHLNEWGRPITYDNYKAMQHGPVPSLAYDFLKSNAKALRDNSVRSLPWASELVPHGKGKRSFSISDHDFDADEALSESDIEAIRSALTIVLSLGFGQIRRLTHEDPAYIEAWRDDGDRAAYDMKLGLLFEEPNFEHAEILAEQSQYV